MSQKKAPRNQLTLLRLSMEPTQDLVNLRRHQGLQNSHTPWIWLIDADVVPDPHTFEKALLLLQSDRVQDVGLIGGKYLSRSHQSFIQKTYNHVCNLWSESRHIPLAGNMLLRRELCEKDFMLEQIPFGQEEYYFKKLCREKGFKTVIEDLPLVHENGKTLPSIIRRCLSQATCRSEWKEPFPWKRYIKTLTAHGLRHPLMTLAALFYFCFNFLASLTTQMFFGLQRESL